LGKELGWPKVLLSSIHIPSPYAAARNSFPVCRFVPYFTPWNGVLITHESMIEKTCIDCYTIPIPLLTSPLKGEESANFPPLQGEGKGGGGVNQVSIHLWTD